MNEQEISELIKDYKDDSEEGLTVKVDLEYSPELHDFHDDFPLAPEQLKVRDEMLSDYCKQIKDIFGRSWTSTQVDSDIV